MKVFIPIDATGFPQQVQPKLFEVVQRVASQVRLLMVGERKRDEVARRAEARTEGPFVVNTVPAVVTVLERPDEPRERCERELRDYLERVACELEGTGARVETVVRFGDSEAEIIAVARAGAFDLVLTGAHEGILGWRNAAGIEHVRVGPMMSGVRFDRPPSRLEEVAA